MQTTKKRGFGANRHRQRGLAIISTISLLALLFLLGTTLVNLTTAGASQARRDETRVVNFNLAEAGMDRILLELWTPFRNDERFVWHDGVYNNAGPVPGQWRGVLTANLNGGRFAAYVIGYAAPDSYTRDITLRSVGWIDLNNNGGSAPDAGEPRVAEQRRIRLKLQQAHVFDYTYFVNNYGWMTGFNTNNLWVNGDMRANGDFTINGGTVNGQVIAAANPNLRRSDGTWGAPGNATVSSTVNMANTTYTASVSTRARQAYSTAHGDKSSAGFGAWQDVLYDQTPDPDLTVSDDMMYGSIIADRTGTRALSSQSSQLSSTPTGTLPMPDLSDINYYRNQVSAVYRDTKQKFSDGTINPDYNTEAYIETWDGKKYVRITGTNGDPVGVVSGSAELIGTATRPIRIHGPVTVMGDIAIKGVVAGQGTLYSGRNVHVIGDVTYADPPSFAGSDPVLIDQANEKKTMLALCARGSVIMGDTTDFGSTPLDYMRPPFTQERKDEQTGAIVPAFDATALDSGYTDAEGLTPKKYQSLLGSKWMKKNATSAIRQIDAVMYTNNAAGGLCGNGSGFTINGSLIAKDEAMVVNLGSGRMTMNYDSRIKERSLQNTPLVDIRLPRTPTLLRYDWKEIAL